MAPKAKVTKEMVADASFQVIRENGHENLQIEIEEWIQDWETDGHSDDKSICYMIIEKEV